MTNILALIIFFITYEIAVVGRDGLVQNIGGARDLRPGLVRVDFRSCQHKQCTKNSFQKTRDNKILTIQHFFNYC